MIDVVSNIALIVLALSIIGCAYRVIVGPTIPDRVVGLDTIGINIIGVVGILAIRLESETYLDVILVIAILSFIGTIAFSKFLKKGVIIDRTAD